MIIKKIQKKKKNLTKLTQFLKIYFLSTIVLGVFLLIIIIQSQKFNETKIFFLDKFSKAGRYEYLYLPRIMFKALKHNFYSIEKIDMVIQFENIIKLETSRKKAAEAESLQSLDNIPIVKGDFFFKQKKFSGDIRLKGDRKAHYIDKEKSSYKVELDKNQYINGMKKFSIQKPRLRNYVHEWIFHELMGDLGIIKVQYEFIELSINGENKGLYVLEEGFGKELVERNNRRNGPIFGIEENINLKKQVADNNPIFEIYNKKYWESELNFPLTRIASQKLRDFFNGKTSAEEVFDLEKWASYFAVVDLTSTYHGAFLKSVKLYYNPINSLFEPIPFDGHRLKPNYHKYNINYDKRILIDIVNNPTGAELTGFKWLKKFFFTNNEKKLNQKFYDLYLEKLKLVSSKKFIDQFLNNNLEKIEKINSHIYSDYFFYDNSRSYGIGLYYFLLDDFLFQAENIRKKLNSNNKFQILSIDNANFLLKPFNDNYGHFKVNKFICENKTVLININTSQKIYNFKNTKIYLPKIEDNNQKDLKCKFVEIFNENNKKTFLLKIDYINSHYDYQDFEKENKETYKAFFYEKNNQLFLKKDHVVIDKNLYIPKNFEVVIESNQKLFLINNAFIVSKSSWTFNGNKGEIIFSGYKDNYGGGILITDVNKKSILNNVKISYLQGMNINKYPEYIILGSINFHQTKLELKNVSFKDISSEDAINIFRSDFEIYDVDYANISSDAIDVDFSNGNINKAKFFNIKNDAIDFSGSNVNINNTYFDTVNDKIISAGENSKINVNQVEGINSYAGIISKDGSKVFSKNVYFDGVKIPFAAYQKKNEYDYPMLEAKNYELKNFLTKSIKDTTANLITEDESLIMKSNQIISLIYEKNFSLIQ